MTRGIIRYGSYNIVMSVRFTPDRSAEPIIDTEQYLIKLFYNASVEYSRKSGIDFLCSSINAGQSTVAQNMHFSTRLWSPTRFRILEYFFGVNVIPQHVREISFNCVHLCMEDQFTIFVNVFNAMTNHVYNVIPNFHKYQYGSHESHTTSMFEHQIDNKPGLVRCVELSKQFPHIKTLLGMASINIIDTSTYGCMPLQTTFIAYDFKSKNVVNKCNDLNSRHLHSRDYGMIDVDKQHDFYAVLDKYAKSRQTQIFLIDYNLFVDPAYVDEINEIISKHWGKLFVDNDQWVSFCWKSPSDDDLTKLCNTLADNGNNIYVILSMLHKKGYRDNQLNLDKYDFVVVIESSVSNSVNTDAIIYAKDEINLSLAKLCC